MDIDEVLKEKKQLEESIKKLVLDYGERTHTRVTDVKVQVISSLSPTTASGYITTDLSVGVTVEI